MAVNTDWISRSLGLTESSNNYAAGRVNEDGRRFKGKYQFGDARLRDLGYTMDEYLSSPEMQEQVFQEHIEDVDSFINTNDLAKYEGQVINGVPMTRDAMYAVAHLGGNRGLRRYLQSGGRYNPSDELGTSLSDYARSHVGPTRAAAGEMTARSSMDASSMAKDGPLGAYADSMSIATRMITEAIERNQPELEARINKPVEDMPPMQGPNLPGGPVGPVQGPQLPTGQPVIPNQMAAPPARPQPNQVTSAMTGGQAGPAYPVADFSDSPMPTPVDNFLSKLFGGTREENRQTGSDMLAMLSQGLGQMSAGQAVNLEPVFTRMQSRQTQLADAQQQQQRDAIAARRLELDYGTLALNKAKHDLEVAKTFGGDSNAAFYSSLADQYPEHTELLTLAANGNKEAEKQVAQMLAELPEQGVAPVEKQALQNYIAAETPEQKLAAISDLGPDARDRVFEAAKEILPSEVNDIAAIQLGERLYNENPSEYPNVGKAIEHAARLNSGSSSEGLHPELIKDNIKASRALRDTYNSQDAAAQDSLIALDLARSANDEAIESGVQLSGTSDFLKEMLQNFGSLAGVEKMEAFAEYAGVDMSAIEQLDEAQQIMARAIAMSYSGQGTISDSERAAMLKEVVSTKMTNLQRSRMIQRLESVNMMDQIDAKYYRSNVTPDTFNDYQQYDNKIKDGSSAKRKIAAAQSQYGVYTYYNDPNVKGKSKERFLAIPKERIARMIFPEIEEGYAVFYKEALPKATVTGRDGLFPTFIVDGQVMHINPDGTVFASPTE